MTPLLVVLASLGIFLPGFSPVQLTGIRVVETDQPVYAGTSATDRTPQRALAISCERGRWEGPSCPDVEGQVIVIDTTLLPPEAHDAYLANVLDHETVNLTSGGWDVGSFTKACHDFPVPACQDAWAQDIREGR